MYVVRCFAADGRSLDVRVQAPSESRACAEAVRRAESQYPAGQWIAAYALEA